MKWDSNKKDNSDMDAEVLGAIGVGLVMAGACGAQVWHKFSGNGKVNGKHCLEHAKIVQTLAIVENDVKWLRKKTEEDTTHIILDGILKHLQKKSNES